jgi:fumarate reductase subunit D
VVTKPMPKRSHEPIFWSLFGAGGVVSAIVLPALVLVTGLAWPLGLMSDGALGYARMTDFAGSLIGGLALFVVISLTFWHAAHRIFHSLHDFGVHRGRGGWKVVCYGTALLGTLWAAVVLATFQS